MAGITLATAQSILDAHTSALSALSDPQTKSATVNGVQYTRQDLDSLNRSVEIWDRRVRRLSRAGNISAHRVVIRD